MAHSVTIGGMTFQVKASASPAELDRFAARVDRKLREVKPKGPYQPKDLALAALALAFDTDEALAHRDAAVAAKELAEARVDDEVRARRELEAEARDVMRRVLARIDLALEDDDPRPEAPAPLPLV